MQQDMCYANYSICLILQTHSSNMTMNNYTPYPHTSKPLLHIYMSGQAVLMQNPCKKKPFFSLSLLTRALLRRRPAQRKGRHAEEEKVTAQDLATK